MLEGLSSGEAVILYRTAERLAISTVVILVALVVTLGFWRSIQRVDFQVTRDKLGGAANLVLATPVFALIALIGFSWVSFSNPISVLIENPAPGVPAPAGAEPPSAAPLATASPATLEFTGIAAVPVQTGRALEMEREQARSVIRTLNCFATAAPDRLENARESDNLARARLAVLAPVWNEAEWGDFEAFRAWALTTSGDAPADFIKEIWEDEHDLC